MAIGDPYIDLPVLKDYLKIKPEKVDNDESLTDALTSASREIERICNRQFNVADTATPRLYAPTTFRGRRVRIDDLSTTTNLVVEYDMAGTGTFTTVPDTDFELYPYSGVVDGVPGWPYTSMQVVPFRYTFPLGMGSYYAKTARFRVTGVWGWPAIPPDVRQACLMMAADTYQQKDSPYGVMSEQFGVLMRPHGVGSGVYGTAVGKLSRYVRNAIMVA